VKVFLPLSIIALVSAPAGVVNAQQGQNCDQIVGQINNDAGAINRSANSYWMHRANYVDLIYGPSSRVVPNATQVADQEKSQADVEKQGMPGKVASLKAHVAAANGQGQNNNGQGQNNNGQGQKNNGQGCLTPAEQSTVVEPAHKQGKRVNFDQIPTPEAGEQNLTGPGPPAMPLR